MARGTSLKSRLQNELAVLLPARHELKLQMHLARNEIRAEWSRLERTWQQVQDELARAGSHSVAPFETMATALRDVLDELRRGYARLKTELQPIEL